MADFHNFLGRIGPFALVDIIGTILGIELLLMTVSQKTPILRLIAYIFGFSAGILSHEIFSISTPLNSLIMGR